MSFLLLFSFLCQFILFNPLPIVMIMVVVYFTFLCETLQTFCFPLQAFQGMDQIKKGFLSKGMFQRLFERFSFCIVLFVIVRCPLTSGAKVVTSLIKSPHWVNLSQHHAVTNDSKITTLYWTRVADSSPGFSLDILGTRKKKRSRQLIFVHHATHKSRVLLRRLQN